MLIFTDLFVVDDLQGSSGSTSRQVVEGRRERA